MGRKQLSLTTKVFLGMVLGIGFGLVAPGPSGTIKIVGDLFINAIKMVVVPLILFSVTLGVADIRDMRTVGKAGVATVLFAAITNLASSLFGVVVGVLVNPAGGVSVPETAQVVEPTVPSWKDIVLSIVPSNVFDAIAKDNVLAIIFFSMFLGIALVKIGKKAEPILGVLRSGSEAIVTMIRMILRFAPYAVFALMAYTVAEYGASILTAMAQLLVTIWIGTILFVVAYTAIVNLLIVKQSPIKFFKALGEASMMAVATCSSMAAMPVNVENTHSKLGVPRETATMVIGAGTAIINGGSGFYKAIGVVFVASLYGVQLAGIQLLVVAAVTAFVVSAGVPAAGTLAIAVALTAFGIPLEGIALLMAIDRLRDMVSTWGNVVIHSLGACTVHALIRRRSVDTTGEGL